MRTNKLLSFLTAVSIAVSSFAGLILSADAQEVTYTWDFTDASFFPETIAIGSNIISDQREETVIMSNPGAKFTYTTGKAGYTSGEFVLVAKADANASDAMQLVIPQGTSAHLDIELTMGSSNQLIYLKDSSGNAVITTSSYTKNIFSTFSCDLNCGETYTLDTTKGKPYIGKVKLTVSGEGGDNPEEPTVEVTEAATETATEDPGGDTDVTIMPATPTPTPAVTTAPTATPTPTPAATADVTEAPETEKPTTAPITGDYYLWEATKNIAQDEELIPGLSAMTDLTYTASKSSYDDGSSFGGYVTHSSTNGGWANGAATGTALRFIAPSDGTIYCYITGLKGKSAYLVEENAEASKADLPNVSLDWFAETAGVSTSLMLKSDEIKEGHTYYCFVDGSKGRFTGVKFVPVAATPEPTLEPGATPGPTPTPDPDAGLSANEKAVKRDAEAIEINSISQTSVYFDLDLDKTGSINKSVITWESSEPDYINIQMISSLQRNWTGVVTRPKEGDPKIVDGGVPVTLTATVTKGDASVTRDFEVSVRQWNPNIYYNDFEADVGLEADGTYKAIADNVQPSNPKASAFRGIRVDVFKDSRCFADFDHKDVDTSASFDKRIMSTDDLYGKPYGSDEEENFAFYYSEYSPYGGTSTIPMWIKLIDPSTGEAPEGIVMMTMDIYVIDGNNKFYIGLANSSPSQMCRFLLANGANSSLGWDGAGYLGAYNSEECKQFMGGTSGYRHPVGKWVKAILIANADSHKWDFYYDGMQIGTGYNFRNAEDCVSNIEFVMDRNTAGGAYLIDNIYVENLTEDYAKTYWDEVGIPSLPYDEETDTYTATAPFLLQYQGTAGLSGNYLKWSSSDSNVLSVGSQRIAVEKLADYGYTAEQIQAYKDAGITDVAVYLATPGNVAVDTKITLTASIEVGENYLDKEFTVIVKPGAAGDATPAPTATVKPSTPSSGGGGGGGGGGGSSSSGSSSSGVSGGSIATSTNTGVTITATAAPEATKRPEGVEAFSDLTLTEWAREAVMYLYEKDIVNGYGDGTFGVNDNVTREQFVKILLTAYGLPIYKHETTSFTDIEEGAWYEHYVETAVRMGLVRGISDTEFGIGQPISRQDIAVMCMRMIDLIDSDIEIPTEEELTDDFAPVIEDGTVEVSEDAIEPDEENADEAAETTETDTASEDTETESEEGSEEAEALKAALQKQLEIENAIANLGFKDKDSITDYALAAVARMAAAGYVTGDDLGNFNPVKISTRAETAAMIYRMIK
ncbi:MAG: S-layer homology domain-containing protein [Candidatus Ornithomonoglobus sp.]